MVGGSGLLIAFELMLVHSKSWQSHPDSSKGVRTSVAAKNSWTYFGWDWPALEKTEA